jgi:VWFA-related protein
VHKAVARAVVVALSVSATSAQERSAVPAFPTQADAITADVVVLDKEDRPVRGLNREDFSLLEDGKPQAIVAFEARELATAGALPPPPVGAERVATNEGGSSGGRTLAFLLDDLGTRHLPLQDGKNAIARWLNEKADPRDEVTVATTSGDLWWSDRVDRGRGDLLAVIERVQSRMLREHNKQWISDWEAYRITVFEDATGAASASTGAAEGASTGPPPGSGGPSTTGGSPATFPNGLGRILDRVAGRTELRPSEVRMRAMEIYNALNRRTRTLLGATERLSRGLAGSRGRKSIVVFSEGLLYDPNQRALFDRAVDASQRGNTVVYFVDVNGLVGGSTVFGAERPNSAPNAADISLVSMEENFLETSGTEHVAENTGGASIRNSNDLFGGLAKVADESSTYYLLGYQPEKSPDGKWHKLEVKVTRPGLKVRTRHGYQAAPLPALEISSPTSGRRTGSDKKASTRPVDPAVMTSGASDAVGLRIAPYAMEAAKDGLARVLVVLEVDTSRLALKVVGERRTGAIDLTLLGMGRDQGKTFPLDERVQIDIEERAAGGWMTLSREIRLPPGVAQVRALVRDVSSGLAGTVTERIEIPPLDIPFLATPILTDRMITARGQAPRLIPVAHRRFQPKGHLFCSYEVVGMANSRGEATLRVAGGFTLRKADGQIVNQADPTPIAVALGGKVRRLFALPLAGLAAGEYELVLDVVDEATGRTLQSREAFVLEASAS